MSLFIYNIKIFGLLFILDYLSTTIYFVIRYTQHTFTQYIYIYIKSAIIR